MSLLAAHEVAQLEVGGHDWGGGAAQQRRGAARRGGHLDRWFRVRLGVGVALLGHRIGHGGSVASFGAQKPTVSRAVPAQGIYL